MPSTFISKYVNFLTEIAKAQIYLICKMGRNDKRKYQRNCALGFLKKEDSME